MARRNSSAPQSKRTPCCPWASSSGTTALPHVLEALPSCRNPTYRSSRMCGRLSSSCSVPASTFGPRSRISCRTAVGCLGGRWLDLGWFCSWDTGFGRWSGSGIRVRTTLLHHQHHHRDVCGLQSTQQKRRPTQLVVLLLVSLIYCEGTLPRVPLRRAPHYLAAASYPPVRVA
jgi:hypothetical protein